MTTKGLSRKQIIILISSDNISIIISQANKYISNMNKLLKNIKSDISANYIWSDNKDIIITTNKTTTMSNINICQVRFTPGWKSTEWTWRWADLWNDLGFSLCAAPSVYHMVATSGEREKVQVGVSTDWCVAIEYWRLSSMRVYLCRLSD